MKTKINTKAILTWFGFGSLLLILGLVLFIRFSPYKKISGYDRKVIKNSIVINKQNKEVYSYICNENEKWMEYVHHTNIINKKFGYIDEEGTIIRYFCNSDETGQQFDGVLIKSIKNKTRKLKLYNFVDFPINFEDVISEQAFKVLPENKCELSMTIFYTKKNPDLWDEIKAHVASYRVKKAMLENLKNIKYDLEINAPETK